MSKSRVLRYIIIYVFLVLSQILIFDQIYISSNIRIFVYILFIIILPININRYLTLILSFILGLTIDIFHSTPGLHASVCVFVGFLRKFILKIVSPTDIYDSSSIPNTKAFGLKWFLKYALLLIFIHNSAIFFLEMYSFEYFLNTILKIVLSSLVSLIFICLIELLIIPGKNERS